MPSDSKKCFAGFAVTITNSTNFYISHYVKSFTYSRERLSEYVPGCHNPVYFPFFLIVFFFFFRDLNEQALINLTSTVCHTLRCTRFFNIGFKIVQARLFTPTGNNKLLRTVQNRIIINWVKRSRLLVVSNFGDGLWGEKNTRASANFACACFPLAPPAREGAGAHFPGNF